ncbi:bifunctional adenosylcobinamide kinase/adenosylcobinamide-phosphate guanylyltransferase [Acetobacter farinalis]|uniref:Adenosylcobinamide kinase n=1 Tax=Acetobacter farinalis TaxID=1260984 RepID=A0ABT3Q9H0_9PROT|nr:bifunctional adenosylcobinamide kinase/adenosylcobinamide-phosphate guanylyltransferase [Acetobacter farinalis]MCX2561935.1 bifunctional adenosylcobinamide kinase/adenosylcobinamide-phosphate guanylyltransferase [Acetobacter farinalis]NHO30511.1 bifunctional adenosylcobinamide kinase/adenosylcobinamide-phosphate guanylyltransferase [Acetobacter farinalis]
MNTFRLKTAPAHPADATPNEQPAPAQAPDRASAPQEEATPPGAGLPGATLVLGGARSGKSRHAETLITALPAPWVYLATGRAFDAEMQERITHHRAGRAEGWITVEDPIDVPAVLRAHAERPLLLDCLTLWLTNLLLEGHAIPAARQALIAALSERRAPTVLVGNEVGLGIVPENKLARQFRDEAGFLHQTLAEHVGKVLFIAAGLPLVLKETSPG